MMGKDDIRNLVLGLSHVAYDLSAVSARCSGLKHRIVEEKLNGSTPDVLSLPLNEEQIKAMLLGIKTHIKSCYDSLRII